MNPPDNSNPILKSNLILPDHLQQPQNNDQDPIQHLIKVAQFLKQNRPEVFNQIIHNIKKET